MGRHARPGRSAGRAIGSLGLPEQPVELLQSSIRFELPIPGLPVLLVEPIPDLRELRGRELIDLRFEPLDVVLSYGSAYWLCWLGESSSRSLAKAAAMAVMPPRRSFFWVFWYSL